VNPITVRSGRQNALQNRGELRVSLKSHWFSEVRRNAQLLYGIAVGFILRRGHHDNRQAAKTGIASDSPQHFDTPDFRNVQVQEHELGKLGTGFDVLQVSQGVLTIPCYMEPKMESASLKHLSDYENIGLVVFNQQDGDCGRFPGRGLPGVTGIGPGG
jgi:hypothetical protein